MASAKRIKIILSSGSLSAESIANNDDLLTKILICVPVKSLFRFKCVSKHWLSLVSDPHFFRRLNISDAPRGLLVYKWSRSIDEFDFINLDCQHSNNPPFETLNFVNHPPQIKIIQSCKGLLLCCSFGSGYEGNYYIYNPTTKQHTLLPPPLAQVREICGVYLAFDPSNSAHYKLICIRQTNFEQPDYHIEIYSSKIGLWRRSAATFSLDFDIGFYGGVFWNGALHWYTDSGPCLYFDVDEEQVKEMPMPPFPDDWYRRRVLYFGESRGSLNLVEIYDPPSKQFNVCELEKDYSGWRVKYRVNLDGVVSEFPEMIRSYIDPSEVNYYVFQIMCIVGREKEEDSYMVLHIPERIIKYEFWKNSFKKLCDFPPPDDSPADLNPIHAGNFQHHTTFEYFESYAPV